MTFPLHTPENAPEAARPILAGAKAAYGFLPNLLAVMAEAPALLKGYTTLAKIFEESSLSATERQIVLLATSYENNCDYCMAAHSAIAGMQKVAGDVIEALRSGQAIGDPKLEALRRFAASVAASRGWPGEADVKAFTDAGYGPAQMLEVILGVSVKTLSNYTNHLAETPLDPAFQPVAWSKSA